MNIHFLRMIIKSIFPYLELCYEREWVQFQEKQICLFLFAFFLSKGQLITLLHSEQPKLYGVSAVLSAIGLKELSSLVLEANFSFESRTFFKVGGGGASL